MFKLYKKYLKNYKKEVFLGPLFKLVEAVFELFVPLIVALIIDKGIVNADKTYIFKMGGLLLVLALLGLLSTLVCQWYACKASQGFGTIVRNDVFKHINKLSPADLDKFDSSYLITIISSDVNQMQLSVAMLIRLVVRAPFLIIGSTIMSMLINFKLSLVFIATTILIFLLMYIIMKISFKHNMRVQKDIDKLSTITKENISGIRVVKSLNNQSYESNRFGEQNENLNKHQVKVGIINAYLNPIVFFIVNASTIILVWFGAKMVDVGELTRGNIVSLASYMTQILLAISVVARLVSIFTKASASGARINEVLDIVPSIYQVSNLEADGKGIIEFRDVSFKYTENAEEALKNISFTINENETIGIIGSTGSGKTTIINLLNRFYESTSGDIFVYGRNLKSFPIEEINAEIGLVFQKAVLFSGTIRENMLFGNKNATDEEILKALKISQATFVDENRLDDIVYEGGKNFSGGEKQRLTIARALVQNPNILILDDTLSALDLRTESILRKELKQSFDKTTIIVSQRINSIKNANRIMVMENGELVGIGSHEQLINNCSVYQEICHSQEVLGGDE